MATESEMRTLMMNMDSDSESDTTEYVPSRKNGHQRTAKNDKFSTYSKSGQAKASGCCPCGTVTSLALSMSAIVNVMLIIVLIITNNQNMLSTDCQQIEPACPGNDEQVLLPGNITSTPTPIQSSPATSRSTSPSPPQTSTTPKTTGPTEPACTKCSSSAVRCGQNPQFVEAPKDVGYVNVFEDLSSAEISATVQYLSRQPALHLSTQRGNEIVGVELYVPTKQSAVQFLDSSSPQPAREALVSVSMSQEDPPVLRQYVVGPLPAPTYYHVNPRMKKAVPLSRRTMESASMALSFVNGELLASGAEKLLFESFGAGSCYSSVSPQCLMMQLQKISFGLMNSTSFSFSMCYNAEFATIHPVPFQVIVSETQHGRFTTRSVYYAGATFSSLYDFVSGYKQGTIRKVSRSYPTNAPGETSIPGSLNLRGEAFPRTPHPPPRQYEAKGSRYSVFRQHVKYLEWSFNVRNSIESGPQIWDVKWSGERIVYELSLQEISVLYAGANPSSMMALLSDSAFGLGDQAGGLVPGVDCPEHATFLSTWFSSRHKPKEIPNTICIFEHNSGVPLRRHSFKMDHKYSGLVDNYLVVRSIIVEFNYDYVLDFIFHANGALETRVYATGYIMSQWFHYGEDPFGFKVHDDVVGSVHHHLFHFKVDLDVGSASNRYETLDFEVDDRNWPWLSIFKPSATSSSTSSSRSFKQISFKHHVRKTEQDAVYQYNFDQPKYHIFYTDNDKNKFGNSRAYRVEVRGFSKQLLPSSHPAITSRKWTQYCMAVTQRKEEEAKSSSIFSMYDADNPVINFEDFLRDDDSIIDKDLVTWVTVGMHHIPHTEDVPNTPTVGTEASILLLPFNYFPEDPSMRSRDAVRVEQIQGSKLLKMDTYGAQSTDFTCLPPPAYGWLQQSNSRTTPNIFGSG